MPSDLILRGGNPIDRNESNPIRKTRPPRNPPKTHPESRSKIVSSAPPPPHSPPRRRGSEKKCVAPLSPPSPPPLAANEDKTPHRVNQPPSQSELLTDRIAIHERRLSSPLTNPPDSNDRGGRINVTGSVQHHNPLEDSDDDSPSQWGLDTMTEDPYQDDAVHSMLEASLHTCCSKYQSMSASRATTAKEMLATCIGPIADATPTLPSVRMTPSPRNWLSCSASVIQTDADVFTAFSEPSSLPNELLRTCDTSSTLQSFEHTLQFYNNNNNTSSEDRTHHTADEEEDVSLKEDGIGLDRYQLSRAVKRLLSFMTDGMEVGFLVDMFYCSEESLTEEENTKYSWMESTTLLYLVCLLNRITHTFPEWYQQWNNTAFPSSTSPPLQLTITTHNFYSVFAILVHLSSKMHAEHWYKVPLLCNAMNSFREHFEKYNKEMMKTGNASTKTLFLPRLTPESFVEAEVKILECLSYDCLIQESEYEACLKALKEE